MDTRQVMQDFRGLCISVAPFATAIGSRMTRLRADTGTTMPYAVYHISGGREACLQDGPIDILNLNIDVTVVAETIGAVDDVCDKLRAGILGGPWLQGSTIFQFVNQQNEFEEYGFSTPDNVDVFTKTQTYALDCRAA